MSQDGMAICRERARAQIALGKRLYQRLRGYATRSDCVDAAHYLINDGGAARQGDDPRWMVTSRSPGLASLLPKALDVERRAVKSWPANVAQKVVARLLMRGARDGAARLLRIYWGD